MEFDNMLSHSNAIRKCVSIECRPWNNDRSANDGPDLNYSCGELWAQLPAINSPPLM